MVEFNNWNDIPFSNVNTNSTDSISDMIARINNAHAVTHRLVSVPKTLISTRIAEILKKEGYIREYQNCINLKNNRKYLFLTLKYQKDGKTAVIAGFERVSKPGARVYKQVVDLPIVRNHLGLVILSTSKGIMTNVEAKKLGIGGEILCRIW